MFVSGQEAQTVCKLHPKAKAYNLGLGEPKHKNPMAKMYIMYLGAFDGD